MRNTANDLNNMFGAMGLLRSMNRIFTDFDRHYGNSFVWKISDGAPRTSMYDSGDKLMITAELPGVKKEDLNVKVQGKYLELSGERKADVPEGFEKRRIERDVNSFTRSFTLPYDIDVDKVEAKLENGLLTLTLPKAESAQPKQITIH